MRFIMCSQLDPRSAPCWRGPADLCPHKMYSCMCPTGSPPCALPQLVENPNDAAVFLPRLLPGLEKVSQEVPDPECRTVAAKARDTLLKIMPEGEAPADPEAHDFKVGRLFFQVFAAARCCWGACHHNTCLSIVWCLLALLPFAVCSMHE